MKKACDRPGYQLTYAATVWPSLAGKYCRPCASGMRWQKPVKPSGSRSMRSFAAGQLPEAKVRTLYHSGKMINVRTPHWKPATSAHKSHSWHHRTVNSKAVLPSLQPAGLTLTQSRVRPHTIRRGLLQMNAKTSWWQLHDWPDPWVFACCAGADACSACQSRDNLLSYRHNVMGVLALSYLFSDQPVRSGRKQPNLSNEVPRCS